MQSRLAELEQYQRESQEVFERLQPHSARIKRIVEDEDAARLFDDSLASYETLRERSKPKLPPEWDPEVNPYIKKIDEMSSKIAAFEQQSQKYQEQQQAEVNQRLLEENTKLSQQLVEKYPLLAERDYAGIKMIASYGIQNKVSFAEAASALEPIYKREGSVEPTLRTNSGAPGVPATSERQSTEKDLIERATELIREQQRKAGIGS